jgi:ubiquinone biosynthesis protein
MFWDFAVKVRDAKRFEQITQALIAFEFGEILHHARIRRVRDAPHATLEAARVRALFEHLGGTFIKLGQLLSVRPDLIPDAYCKEFSKLQDHVAPMSFSDVERVLEAEWGKQHAHVLAHIDRAPVASASIAQVHQAVLRSGKTVAIKVQRPQIAALIESDLDIMRVIAAKIKEHLAPQVFDPVQVVEEIADYTRCELDFLQEAKNIEAFRENFAHSPTVTIPRVHPEQTTSRVLVMEFLDGKELRAIGTPAGKMGARARRIVVRRIADAVLKQIFIDGIFHADPHPGNILVLAHNRIGFVDFGIVGRIDPELKNKLQTLFIALIGKDLPGISGSLIALGFAPHGVDESRLREDLHVALGPYHDSAIEKVDIAEVFTKCIEVAKRHRIRLPRNFVLLGKSLVTLEGIGAEYDPDFNLVRVARPFVEKLVKDRIAMRTEPRAIVHTVVQDATAMMRFARSLPERADQLIAGMETKRRSDEVIESDLRALTLTVSSAVTRMVFGLIIVDLLIVMIVLWNQPPINASGVSSWSFTAFGGALFFFALFLVLAHEEKRRALKTAEY